MYPVIFVRNFDVTRAVSPGTILIAPSPDSWNDFGQRIRTEIAIHKKDGSERPLHIIGFIGFLDKRIRNADARFLRGLLDREPERDLTPEDTPQYFTMLPDMAAYREIVEALGPDEATIVLKSMNDVVAMGGSTVGQPWLREAQQTTLFHKAFLRSSEAYVAWKNAAPILQGLAFEQADVISSGLSITFELSGRPNAHRLNFRFSVDEGVLPRRFGIVIGKNGVGKSQALGRIAKAALKGSSDLQDPAGDRPSINRILAFSPTSTTASVFPPVARKGAKIWYRRFAIGHPGTGRGRQTTSDLIIQLARSEQRVLDDLRLNFFLNAIRALDVWEELALPARDGPPVPLSGLTRGGEEELLERFASIDLRQEPVRFVQGRAFDLSSGELAFVRFAALASLYIENGTLLLLDEPETHLHPNFISQFVALLDRLLSQTGSAAIIATHSVYFVREAFEDQVIVLRSGEDRRIEAEIPVLKTFGADVGAISYFVFGQDQPSRLAQAVEDRIAKDAKSWRAAFAEYKDELSLDLLGEIRADIEARLGPERLG